MSLAIDSADLMKTRLATAPAAGEIATPVDLRTVPVVVFRQTALQAEVSRAVAKGSGAAIVIVWEGCNVPDPGTHRPRLEQRYQVGVFGKHTLAGTAKPADGIAEAVILRLWDWRPDAGHCHGACRITGCAIEPDPDFLIYTITATIPTHI